MQHSENLVALGWCASLLRAAVVVSSILGSWGVLGAQETANRNPRFIEVTEEQAAVLYAGDGVSSASEKYHASLQGNCEFKLFSQGKLQLPDNAWDLKPTVPDGSECFAVLHPDGNFAIYARGKEGRVDTVWQSGADEYSSGHNYFLALSEEGDLVMYRGTPAHASAEIWSAIHGRVTPNAFGFRLVGGAAGIALFAALNDLVEHDAVSLRPARVRRGDGAISIMRREYVLPPWVSTDEPGRALCTRANGHACAIVLGTPKWRIHSGETAIPPDACSVEVHQQQSVSNYICIPDISVKETGRLYVTRRFLPMEAQQLPQVVTKSTHGCKSFDRPCQLDILIRNTRQHDAWRAAAASGVLTPHSSNADDSKNSNSPADAWWLHLSGTLTLPAVVFNVEVSAKATDISPFARCDDIQHAVIAANAAIRRPASGLAAGAAPTTAISSNCVATSLRELSTAQPQAFNSAIPIATDKALELEKTWRSLMGWPAKPAGNDGTDGDGMLVGIWDGMVLNKLPTFNRGDTAKFFRIRDSSDDDDNLFLEGNVISWIDKTPKSLNWSLLGPCGAAVYGDPAAHATVIAAMLSGAKEGVAINARLWVHIWSAQRLQSGFGPGASVAWFNKNVPKALINSQLTYAPIVANLSCGAGKADDVRKLKEDIAGISQSGQQADVAPYVVTVAAGNRDLTDPGERIDGDNPAGFSSLGRRPETAGFISVVAFGPSGTDVLRCGDLRGLARMEMPPGDPIRKLPFSDLCPSVDDNDASIDHQSLVKFGTAFDVAAIGLGIGPAPDGSGSMIMFGSSFAAPRVAALALELTSKTRKAGAYATAVTARAVADRIRFTTDRVSNDFVRFGVINANRALNFDHDVVELLEPSDPASPSQDHVWVRSCTNAGGVVEIDRARQATIVYPNQENNGESVELKRIFRLRRIASDQAGLFDAMLLPTSGGTTADRRVFKVNLSDKELPVVCTPLQEGQKKIRHTPISTAHIASVTRCSFVRDAWCN